MTTKINSGDPDVDTLFEQIAPPSKFFYIGGARAFALNQPREFAWDGQYAANWVAVWYKGYDEAAADARYVRCREYVAQHPEILPEI
jgi:hypothetical protein